jgi:hypothetical protein
MGTKLKKSTVSIQDIDRPPWRDFGRLACISLLVLLGTTVAYFQPFGLSPDYADYSKFFDLTRQEELQIFSASRFEPGFSAAALGFTFLFSTNIEVYTVFVFFCLLSKFIVINALSKSFYSFLLAGLVYLFCFFPLHELTQLRVACSTSFIFLGLLLISRKKIALGSVTVIMAIVFHYSIIALIPFLYCKFIKLLSAVVVALLTYLLLTFNSQFIAIYLQGKFQTVAQMGVTGFGDNAPNLLNAFNVIKIAAVIIAILSWSYLTSHMKQVVLIQLVSLGIFYSMTDFPVIAFRIFEMFSITWVVFIAEGLTRKKTQSVCFAIAFLYCVPSIYLFFIAGKFFQPI